MNKKNLINIINNELLILTTLIEGFDKDGNIKDKEIELTISKVKDIYDELVLLRDSDEEIVSEEPKAVDDKKDSEIIINAQENDLIEDNRIKDSNDNTMGNQIEDNDIVEKQKQEERVEVESDLPKQEEVVLQEEVEVENKIDKEVEVLDNNETELNVANKEEITEVEEEIIESSVEEEKEVKPEVEEKKVEVEEISKVEGKGRKIIADTFIKNRPSINDMLSDIKSNKNLAATLKDGPISNLKTAIKLNDRIWYVNELFNKNSSTYEKTIDDINNCSSLDDALEYLVTRFNWDQNKKSTISFLELIFRRFAN
jgi:hypothetical protein